MNRYTFFAFFMVLSNSFAFVAGQVDKPTQNQNLMDGFRPPAVPLIVFDPFMSIWSMSDNLYDSWPQLWCGKIKAIIGAIMIDGKAFRFMGPDIGSGGIDISNVMTQKSVAVQPTQTIYTFEAAGVQLVLRFTTPTIPTDLDLLSQPVTYITFTVTSLDGEEHSIKLYYDQTAEVVIDDASEEVSWSRPESENQNPQYIMKIGSTTQNILGNRGDCMAINWGYAYIGVSPVDKDDSLNTVFGGAADIRSSFVSTGAIPEEDDIQYPRPANNNWPVMAVSWDLRAIPGKPTTRYLIFAYDDIKSISFFGDLLPPYWRRNGADALNILSDAARDYTKILTTCENYDQDLIGKLAATGGPKYATLGALVFRQAFGGCKLVWNEKLNLPWYFMKEISSNGDLHTVDVIFPSIPIFLYTNPYLVELMMLPHFAYANNETDTPYNLAWAPHHLGTYPIADLKPQDQEQMPIEETGNLLMIVAALIKLGQDQNGDYQSLMFPKHQSLTNSWAEYLLSGAGVLPDPNDQLCTDDFLGPLSHNTNLALKGIVGLGCYASALEMLGFTNDSKRYLDSVKNFAQFWLQNASDEDHYRLQYDLPNTWSLKYNLLFQYIMDDDIFPNDVISKEVTYLMKNHLNKYGISLNNNVVSTKIDWLSWIAAMSPNPLDRDTLFERIYNFANETPDRVPLTDWYDTDTGKRLRFQARAVLGAFYANIMLNPGL